VAVVDGASGRLLPFVRSLGVKAGSRAILRDHYPRLARPATVQFWKEQVWYLPPRPDSWIEEPVVVRYVVFPRAVAGARSTLSNIGRSAAIDRLLSQAFNLRAHGSDGLRQLVALLQRADCYELTMGDLAGAVTLLQRLVAHPV
jgi:hypothetical protein